MKCELTHVPSQCTQTMLKLLRDKAKNMLYFSWREIMFCSVRRYAWFLPWHKSEYYTGRHSHYMRDNYTTRHRYMNKSLRSYSRKRTALVTGAIKWRHPPTYKVDCVCEPREEIGRHCILYRDHLVPEVLRKMIFTGSGNIQNGGDSNLFEKLSLGWMTCISDI